MPRLRLPQPRSLRQNQSRGSRGGLWNWAEVCAELGRVTFLISLFYFARFSKHGLKPINMLKQVFIHFLPHWVEDKLNAFSASKFCRWDKIGIASNQDDCAR